MKDVCERDGVFIKLWVITESDEVLERQKTILYST